MRHLHHRHGCICTCDPLHALRCVLLLAGPRALQVLSIACGDPACCCLRACSFSKCGRLHALRLSVVFVCRPARAPSGVVCMCCGRVWLCVGPRAFPSVVVCMRCARVLFILSQRPGQVLSCACDAPDCCCLLACSFSMFVILHAMCLRLDVYQPTRSPSCVVCMRCARVLLCVGPRALQVLSFACAALACGCVSGRALSKCCRLHALRLRVVVCWPARSPSFAGGQTS